MIGITQITQETNKKSKINSEETTRKVLTAFMKSSAFRNLVAKTRNCSKCKAKKQQLAKSAKLIDRVSFKPSKEF